MNTMARQEGHRGALHLAQGYRGGRRTVWSVQHDLVDVVQEGVEPAAPDHPQPGLRPGHAHDAALDALEPVSDLGLVGEPVDRGLAPEPASPDRELPDFESPDFESPDFDLFPSPAEEAVAAPSEADPAEPESAEPEPAASALDLALSSLPEVSLPELSLPLPLAERLSLR